MAVNYKLLLFKYIWHVGEAEGSIFSPATGYSGTSIEFTAEEKAAFQELEDVEHFEQGVSTLQ
jgi:hypothetical protein